MKNHDRPRRRATLALGIALLATSCTVPGESLYGARDVGVVIDTTEAIVVASRPVAIEGGPTRVGPIVGAASAATLAGSLIGGGTGATIAAVLGGLLGFAAGHAAEKELASGEGLEYVLETTDGRTLTIVQRTDDQPPIADGTPVLLQMAGGYSRVIEHPSIDADADLNTWRNPDAIPAPPPDDGDPLVPPPPQQQ
jgi:outer membrane lipoprotein SlyB